MGLPQEGPGSHQHALCPPPLPWDNGPFQGHALIGGAPGLDTSLGCERLGGRTLCVPAQNSEGWRNIRVPRHVSSEQRVPNARIRPRMHTIVVPGGRKLFSK